MDAKKENFDSILDHLKTELSKLRTGRANPGMIEGVKVDYFGSPTPINQLGNVTVPEARQLLILPWDKGSIQAIEKAIRDSGLGLNPANEGDKIRLNIPPLTEERRKELTKISGKVVEEARVRVRSLREDLLKDLKKQEEGGKIREDEKFRQQEALQKMVDEYNAKIKEIADAKEKEIMTV